MNVINHFDEYLNYKSILEEIYREIPFLDLIILKNPKPIAVFDESGYLILSNNAYLDLFKGKFPKDYSIFKDPFFKKKGMIKEIISSLKDNKVVEIPEMWYNIYETYPNYPDNEICIKITAFPLLDKEANLKYIILTYDNNTEKSKAQQELEKEKTILKNIIELNPYAIQIFDKNGDHLGCNKAFIDLYHSEPPKGYNFLKDPIHQKLGNVDIFKRHLKGEIIYTPENWYNPHDLSPHLPDKLVCHNAVGFPIFNPKGEVEKVIYMYEDITERKLAEKKLEELKKQLENRVKERTLLLEESEKKYCRAYRRANCYRELFTHDVSNIFHIISNSLELIKEAKYSIFDEEEKKLIDAIEKSLKRGKKLVSNIRNLSELEETEIPITEIDINLYIDKAIEFLNANFQQRTIKIERESSLNGVKVLANELLLDVFENILINAVRYNRNPIVEIQISISEIRDNENNSFIQMEFKDNGIGISDERKQIIFEKGHYNNKGNKGMGLGLSLVSKILELYEGKIWVEDRIPGDYLQGSNFIVQIPAANN
ncbi:MAG: ATP-binding protein [Promethearchaeota archaeon]